LVFIDTALSADQSPLGESNSPTAVNIFHLHDVPHLLPTAASMIHAEFWADVPEASPDTLAQRLAQVTSAASMPLCRVAVSAGELVGVVNLIDYDDPNPRVGRPWLAGLVVAPKWRGQGVGSVLVRTLLDDASRLGESEVFLGTDGPGFYERLGAHRFTHPREGFWLMRFDLAPPRAAPRPVV
jgi:predicted N-acetyltransferase YhbS